MWRSTSLLGGRRVVRFVSGRGGYDVEAVAVTTNHRAVRGFVQLALAADGRNGRPRSSASLLRPQLKRRTLHGRGGPVLKVR